MHVKVKPKGMSSCDSIHHASVETREKETRVGRGGEMGQTRKSWQMRETRQSRISAEDPETRKTAGDQKGIAIIQIIIAIVY